MWGRMFLQLVESLIQLKNVILYEQMDTMGIKTMPPSEHTHISSK